MIRAADLAGQRLWALGQEGANKATNAAALGNTEGQDPQRRRMPWEED